MLVHLRLTAPTEMTDHLRDLLLAQECVTNLTVHEGVVLEPEGDLVEVDVAREATGEVLQLLEDTGLAERGGIVVVTPTGAPFARAAELEAAAPGHPDDAVIWDSVIAQADDGSVPTVSYLVFLVLAVTLAGIAVVTDSAILVIGAMVVGPEFGAVAAASAGIVLGRWATVGRSIALLAISFTFAVVVVLLLALLARLIGLLTIDLVTKPRPNTGFIWHPDAWSFIVALVAGAAGALALAIEKTATMVGVFISVTTVPAAGNLALGLAVWDADEILGSLGQLGINLGGMVLSGTLLLGFMRLWWPQVMRFSERVLPQRPAARR